MASSLVLLFLHYSGAEIKSVTPPGMVVEFSNPDMALKFILVFQVYFGIRYYQYFVQEQHQSLREKIHNRFEKLSSNRLKKLREIALPNAENGSFLYAWWNTRRAGFMKNEMLCNVKSEDGSLMEASFTVSLWQFIPHYLAACVLAIFNTSYLTDYVLPVVIAAYALWLYI